MESVGEFFRQVRETKGLTVDEVASKTRIRTDFVKALEDGNFAKLPDQVFARGFVRSYARSLGLDEEDAIHRFIQSAGSFYEKQDERERLKIRQVEEDRKRQANRKTVAIAIGVAVLTLIFLLSREQSAVFRQGAPEQASLAKRPVQAGKDLPEPSARGPEHAPETAKPSEVPTGLSKSTADTPHKKDADSTAVAVSKVDSGVVSTVTPGSDGPLAGLSLNGVEDKTDGQLVLDLEATELSWVVVQIDNGSPQESLLRPGEKSHWTGQDQFILTLGNAGGVKAELNGKPQKPFGPSGKVARDIVLKR
ncbi:MAG: helix-turn-helix domain-containing protein [Nitrospira sp.]|nr:helix-turn-helix domain-containing protein [Nitrospira sp.]